MTTESSPLFPPHAFSRHDETDDRSFYDQPRLVVHIDEAAITALGAYFERTLVKDGVILDLMSSWRSHLPNGLQKRKLVGLGLNKVEMAENPQLDERVVLDINAVPMLPFADASFDAVVVTVSIQYLTRPIEVFREVNRVLKHGSAFHVVYSNRMFLAKAVAIWQALTDQQRGDLIKRYFELSKGWSTSEWLDITPPSRHYTDPLFVVSATRTT